VSIPSLVDLMVGAKPFQLDLKFSLRDEAARFGLLLSGPNGWGEFAPFAYHSATHQARWLQAAIEMSWGNLPNPKKEKVKVNAIVPAVEVSKIPALISSVGSKSVKVKFSAEDVELDLKKLAAVLEVEPKAKFRIDFNQALKADLVDQYLSALSDFDIEYLEEPSSDGALIKKIQKSFAVAIDESIRLQNDAANLNWMDEFSWADYWILKPIPLGGFERVQKIAEVSKKPVVISGSFDSSVGLYLTTLCASWFSDLPAGAATGSLLSRDVIEYPLVATDGEILVKKIEPETILTPAEERVGKLFRQLEAAYFELLQLEG
jgi:o-succinylbenzoate synthase